MFLCAAPADTSYEYNPYHPSNFYQRKRMNSQTARTTQQRIDNEPKAKKPRRNAIHKSADKPERCPKILLKKPPRAIKTQHKQSNNHRHHAKQLKKVSILKTPRAAHNESTNRHPVKNNEKQGAKDKPHYIIHTPILPPANPRRKYNCVRFFAMKSGAKVKAGAFTRYPASAGGGALPYRGGGKRFADIPAQSGCRDRSRFPCRNRRLARYRSAR